MASTSRVAAGASGITGVLVAFATFGLTEFFSDRDASRDAKIERARIEIEVDIASDRAEQVERLLDRQEKQFRIAFDRIADSCRHGD